MPAGYFFNTILGLFNLFDTIGRFLPNYVTISLKVVGPSIFSRIILFILFGLSSATLKYDVISVSNYIIF